MRRGAIETLPSSAGADCCPARKAVARELTHEEQRACRHAQCPNGRASILKALPGFGPRSAFIDGKPTHFQPNAITATGTTQKNAHPQPTMAPRKLPNGAAKAVASAFPPFTITSARGTWCSGTSRMAVAADIDRKPPMEIPINARPNMKIA